MVGGTIIVLKIGKKAKQRIGVVLFLLALIFGFNIISNQVIHAKTIPNVITSMKVTSSEGKPLQGDLKK